MKNKGPLVQVFLTGNDSVEVSGRLVKYEQIPEIQALRLGVKCETDYYVEYVLPLSQIRMIRLFESDEE